MVRVCNECNGVIRGAGRKYCSYCRNKKEVRNKNKNTPVIQPIFYKDNSREDIALMLVAFLGFVMVAILIIGFFDVSHNDDKNKSITDNNSLNFSSEQNLLSEYPISPEEKLQKECLNEFTNFGLYNLKSMEILEDEGGAISWLELNYNLSVLTEEQRQINIENFKKKKIYDVDYPIIMTLGDKKINENVVEHGYYVCNLFGIV